MTFKLTPRGVKRWKVVIVAFAVSAVFWLFNSLNKDYTTSLRYPVRFVYNRDSLVSVKTLPSSIDLDVTGGGWNLLRKEPLLNPKPLEIPLENPVGKGYLSWLEMLPSIREHMGDISVNQVFQDTLRIQIEPILKKRLRIWVDSASIKLANDFRLVSSIFLPDDSITLIGPKSFIDTLQSTFELQFLEENIDENFDDEVPVRLPRPKLIHSEPARTKVRFEVDHFDELQIKIPVEAINFPANSRFVLADPIVTIYFTVQRSLQQDYVASDFGISADFNMLRKSDSTVLSMMLYFPEEVNDLRVEPKEIRVIANE